MTQKHGLVATERTVILGCINESIMSKIKEVITLCYSALVRPHLRPSVRLQAYHFKGDVNKSILRERVVRIEKGLAKSWEKFVHCQKFVTGLMGEEEAVDLFCVFLQGCQDLMGRNYKKADLSFTKGRCFSSFFFIMKKNDNKSFGS